MTRPMTDSEICDLLDAANGALADAMDRIEALEKRVKDLEADTPQARQLQYEADLAAADLAASGGGYPDPVGAERHGPGCLCPYCPDEEEPVTEPASRIRWEPNSDRSSLTGYAGTYTDPAFLIYAPSDREPRWLLSCFIPCPGNQLSYEDSEDEVKARAEARLSGFVSSLGAVFPDCPDVTRFEAIDHTLGLASISPVSTRAVVAYGIRAELAFQDDGRTLKVFLTRPETAPSAPGKEEG